MSEPLAGLRVLEHSGDVATRYCGRLFAASGAEVIRIAGGDDARLGYAGEAGRAYGAWLDQRKRVVDDAAAEGPFDLIIAGQDGRAVAAAETFRTSRPERPSLLALTWFDPEGPYGAWRGTDEIIQALCGLAFAFGEAEGPPMLSQGHAAQVVGGVTAYNATLAAVMSAPGRRPGRIAVNILEANLCFSEPGAVATRADGTTATRMGVNRFSPTYPAGSYRTSDGWVGITCLTPAQWRSFCGLIGRPDLGAEPRYATSYERLMLADELDPILISACLTHTTAEWLALGGKHRIPTAPMPTPGELPREPHWAARGAFAPVGDLDIQGPTLPYRMAFDGVRTPRWSGDPALGPLAGMKVVDFSMGWAGPLCARTLGDLGADVVKIESDDHPDWWRGWEANAEDRALMEMRHNFLGVNRNKRGVCIDLTRPEGVARAKALIAGADVVIENYAAGVLEKLGLGQAVQRALRPGIVSLTMPAFGAVGPLAGLRAYGSTVEQACGLPFANGEAHWPPCLEHVAFGDPVAGLYGASAVLTALAGRERLGGADIDLAQVACLFQLGADSIVAAEVLGEPLPRTGCRRARLALCTVTAVRDGWLAVAAENDAMAALARVAGAASEEALRDWAAPLAGADAAARLQGAGLAAARVQGAHDLTYDPQLMANGYWVELERAVIGRHLVPAAPFSFDGVRPPLRRPAPTLGQHTDEVLAELV
ncbi:MAG: L-carnitine dehydratase/bile acid-inducible protein [Caulobacteraceae bacterium]|nr:L-carnitine dehydratase/bile acid-inducible protein [Caulobacteraceae bacterium]